MTKALAVQRPGLQLTDITAMQRFATACVAAGVLDSRQGRDAAIATAIVQVQYGAELGMGPMESLRSISVIKGKPVLGAGAIAARIKASERYDYRVVKLDATGCEIEVVDGDNVIGTSSFTDADAKTAGLNGDNWRRYRRNMMFARAISNAARWYCADVFQGSVYSAEEVADEAGRSGTFAGTESGTGGRMIDACAAVEQSPAPAPGGYDQGDRGNDSYLDIADDKPTEPPNGITGRMYEFLEACAIGEDEGEACPAELQVRCTAALRAIDTADPRATKGRIGALIGECKAALASREPGEEG
jgi:hypothetical protein